MQTKKFEWNWDGVALIVSAVSLVLVVVKSLEFSVPAIFVGTQIEPILTSKSTKTLIDVLCGGIVGAYVFYLMVDKFPARRKEKQSLQILDELIGTILESYKSPGFFSHQLPIDWVALTAEEMAILANSAESDIKSRRYHYAQLWVAIQTADSRYSDICHALSLTTMLSLEHTRQWLKITDRVRLMHEEYFKKPENTEAEVYLDIKNLRDEKYANNATASHIMTLEALVIEFMRDVRDWGKLNNRAIH